ncbi:MAG TPA: hypothetical protein VNB24_04145 [Acidimicrobiales bacterium]|nr:hypothetical protein [Acidimicrobiales bacterium]
MARGRIGTWVAVGGVVASITTIIWAASAAAVAPDTPAASPSIGAVAPSAPVAPGSYTVDLRDFGLRGDKAATGTLTLHIGREILGPVAVVDGRATFRVTDVDERTDEVRVSYSGDANFGAADFTLRRVGDTSRGVSVALGAAELSPLGVPATVASAVSSRSDPPSGGPAQVLGSRLDREVTDFAHQSTDSSVDHVPLVVLAGVLAALAGLGILIAGVPARLASRRSIH